MSIIRLTNLSKKYGAFSAVDNLSLEVKPGEIFAFLGTNGAGKTTTIKMMTGVIEPTAGTVEIGGYNIQTHPVEAKSLMGVIPDRPYLYGKLTGREFLSFMAELYIVPHRTAANRIEEMLSLYGILEWQHDLIDSYSHGMKQRLLMCASLLHNPALLVVDEPMVGLDPRGARLLKDTFRERAAQGLTIFMSTHSLSVAEEIADRLAIIKRGKLIALGTLAELFAKVRNNSNDFQMPQSETLNNNSSQLENLFLQLVSEGDEWEEE
mgnify:CR=1 FL=1